MAHDIGYVDNAGTWDLAHYNMLRKIRRFAMGYGGIENYSEDSGNTGDGTVEDKDALPDAVDETWTLECTGEATTNTGAIFSVTGSVSGAQSDVEADVGYENDYVSFEIITGSTDFAVGDTFTFDTVQSDVSANDENWEELRYDTSGDNHELILMGQGLTGTEEIFVGFRTYQNAGADYYNLVAMAATGYVSGNSFDNQPNAFLSGVPAHNQRIDYWLSVNGQRIALAMKVGTPVYEAAYVGKFLPYALPHQFPYPIVCGGMLDGVPATRFSEDTYSMPYKGDRVNMRMRDTDGTWRQIFCYPYSNDQDVIAGDPEALRETGGYYHLMPVELFDPNNNLYGALDGIFFVTGFDNTVENTLTIDGVDYVVMQDVWRTGFNDYYAIRMDT